MYLQRRASPTIGCLDGQFPIVTLAMVIQGHLELLQGVEVFIFPGHVCQGAMIALDMGLIGGTSVAAKHVSDAQTEQPQCEQGREVAIRRTDVHHFTVSLDFQG
jgi:hypothetical protein